MTDKQIIIDVSDCSELCGTKCHILMSCTNTSKSDSCSEMPNCYYKQLKAKEQECETLASQLDFEVQKKECLEQECERLKKIINEAKNSKLDLKSFLVGEAVQNEYEQQLDQLKAENEELKEEQNKKRDHYFIISNENARLQDEKARLGYKLNSEIQKLKQTLTEIKEIAERDKEFCIKCNGNKEIDCVECIEGGRALLANEILQKISECEVE